VLGQVWGGNAVTRQVGGAERLPLTVVLGAHFPLVYTSQLQMAGQDDGSAASVLRRGEPAVAEANIGAGDQQPSTEPDCGGNQCGDDHFA
jgi:hypothetical protein